MPLISKKGNLMPESPIRKLVPYAEERVQTRQNSLSFKHRSARY